MVHLLRVRNRREEVWGAGVLDIEVELGVMDLGIGTYGGN